MQILNRQQDSFAEEFERLINKRAERIVNPECGTLLFNASEVYAVPYPLDRMLRKICVTKGITRELWIRRSTDYAFEVEGLLPDQATNKANNTLKSLYKVPISTKTWSFFLGVMGYIPSQSKLSFTGMTVSGDSETFEV